MKRALLKKNRNEAIDNLDDLDYFLEADPRMYRFLLDPANIYYNIPIEKLKEHVRMLGR